VRGVDLPRLEAVWLDDRALLNLAELFEQLRKDELSRHLPAVRPHARLKKQELFDRLGPQHTAALPLSEWCPELGEPLFSLSIGELCERLRLLFFGNLRQDWSDFVLTRSEEHTSELQSRE